MSETGRTFELVIKPKRNDETEIRRQVTLSADLGLFEDLKNCPIDPIDLLTDQAVVDRVATDKYLQGRLLFAMSDAQDLDPRAFARGLVAGTIAQALVALRGALRDFFHGEGMEDIAQALDTAFDAMVAGRKAMARNIRDAGVSERIVEALESDDIKTALGAALDDATNQMKLESLMPGS